MTNQVKYNACGGLMCLFFATLTIKLTFAETTNDVYPANTDKENSVFGGNYSGLADDDQEPLRDFIMNYVEDKSVCRVAWLRDLVVGKNGSGIGWWARRCFAKSSRMPDVSRKHNKENNNDDALIITKEVTEELSKNYKNGQCRPVRQLIEIGRNDPLGAVFIPCSVMVKRCAGCCFSGLQECVPLKTREKAFVVMKVVPKIQKKKTDRRRFSFPPNSSLVQKIKVTEHTKCECQCKVKSDDCSSKQIYDPESCSCTCPTAVDRTCNMPQKIWSENHCGCFCRKKTECTTGLIFSEDSCSCELQNSLSSFLKLQGNSIGKTKNI